MSPERMAAIKRRLAIIDESPDDVDVAFEMTLFFEEDAPKLVTEVERLTAERNARG